MDYIQADSYYSIVPEWVLDLHIPAQAIRLYAVLCRYADKDSGECFPSIKTLAGRMHTSSSTVKRALADLRNAGAITSVPRYDKTTGEQTSNLYTVLREKPKTIYEHPQLTDEPKPSSDKNYKPKSDNQRINATLFVALTEAIGRTPATQTERAGWNKCVKELREANATAEQIKERAETYKKTWRNMSLTPFALIKHWSFLEQVIEENKEPTPYDCKKSGHKFFDNGIFGKKNQEYHLLTCRVCLFEKHDKLTKINN
tara:strand:- start:105 stop:875 length:771 start_codon:yes stop_codon:yes gene_type:complete